MSSSRRRNSQPAIRSRGNEGPGTPSIAQLTALVKQIEESIVELKTDVLMLTRKLVSLEAELDYVQDKRQLR